MEKLQQTYNLKQTIKEKNKQIKQMEEYNLKELEELRSQVEWFNFFVDYVQCPNRNLYNSACEYADKKEDQFE